ncbi:MAG: NYN domain-containing protein, partial [Rhodocyclaceae bacterium]|nr:NYN domain-containing protein [Rhodocyclaceae bacterium]
MNAGNGHKVMLLVDADNVSADVMEQAVRGVIAEHGHLHVRRAYCTAEVALKHQQLFKRLSMRPMVNLAAGKNSTDIALAVDAMDLVMAERPQLVYLVSSDSDFAPLVNRLREKGCRVCGIGQQGKTGEETRAAYDHFIDLKHKGAGTAAAPADAPPARPARKAAAKKTGARRGDAAAPASEVDTVRAADAVPAARAPARKSAARKTATTRGART